MSLAVVHAALTQARSRVMGALLRRLRDLDAAEEACQTACLRALRQWPAAGVPDDPAAWLIRVGFNAAVDDARRRKRLTELPDEDVLSDLEDAEGAVAAEVDARQYPDDVLRLLFICCHPDLPAAHQMALALRVVCGLSTARIARAFLIGEDAMEQRLTRAKGRISKAGIPFGAPGGAERAERLEAVMGMLYLLFNEGYSDPARLTLCNEAIRLARQLRGLFPEGPEVGGLLALMLLQHARAPARFDGDGRAVLLDAQDRDRWDRRLVHEGLTIVQDAARRGMAGPYVLQAAIAAEHGRAERPEHTNWPRINQLYALLEQVQPSPVVTLNRAVAVAFADGPEAALAMLETVSERLSAYAHFHGARGALLLKLGRHDDARPAFEAALALADTPALADHIRRELEQCSGSPMPSPPGGI